MTLSQPDHQIADMLKGHNLINEGFAHTNLEAPRCACQSITLARPNTTGDFCLNCGGMMVRTGTCTACVECGNSGGCG